MHKSLFLCLPFLLLTACNAVSADNYSKLHTGMNLTEVQDLLGKPAQCSEILMIKKCTWGNAQHYITVSFAADTVMATSASGL